MKYANLMALGFSILGIGIMGHFSGNILTGPVVTAEEIVEKNMFNKTVTMFGTAVGVGYTQMNKSPVMLLKDKNGQVVRVVMMPGSFPPEIKTGFDYKVVGTPLSWEIISCNWPKSVEPVGEYKISQETKAFAHNGRFIRTGHSTTAPDGWHNVRLWRNYQGKSYTEVLN